MCLSGYEFLRRTCIPRITVHNNEISRISNGMDPALKVPALALP